MNMVTLRTGVELPVPLVLTTTLALERTLHEAPIAFYDLVMLAREGAEPFPPSVERLKALALLRHDGTLHDGVRDVVLASTEGADENMRLVDPVRR
jgi:hypothetical protein